MMKVKDTEIDNFIDNFMFSVNGNWMELYADGSFIVKSFLPEENEDEADEAIEVLEIFGMYNLLSEQRFSFFSRALIRGFHKTVKVNCRMAT